MTVSVQIIQAPPEETAPQREFYVNAFPASIGRDYAAAVSLPDLSNQMSRAHLMIFQLPSGGYQVSDVSTNGATLNGAPLARNTATPLVDGDVLAFTGYKLLIGILGAVAQDEAPPQQQNKPTLEIATDLSSEAPILADAAVEQARFEPEPTFSQSEIDLNPDLMFDPFADGPEIDESAAKQDLEPAPEVGADAGAFTGLAQLPDLAQPSMSGPGAQDAMMRAMLLYRNMVNDAVERAFDRFIDDIDPAILQREYDAFLPLFGQRKARYWSIHLAQFAQRKARGQYRRNFMAMLAEEVRKL